MKPLTPVPHHLVDRAFTRAEAIAAGLTDRMLDHPRFIRVHPCVYRLRTTRLDRRGCIAAAALALPVDAVLSHTTRLELEGVSVGESRLHFTIGRELHLELDDVMLHRTVKLPPLDAAGVSVPAAWIQAASIITPVRAISAADRLLANDHVTRGALEMVVALDPWRPGAEMVERLLPWLDPRSASMPESAVRVLIAGAGLEVPEVNVPVLSGPGPRAIGDLVYRRWRLLVEYEGRHHALDTSQFAWDIERYREVQEAGWAYLRLTARDLANPRRLVRLVHQALVAQGYDGPPPEFGPTWHWLLRTPRLRVPAGR